MSKINKVVACGRRVHRNTTKRLRPAKTERDKHVASEEPTSNTHMWADAMQQKGSRVMKATVKENRISFNQCEYRSTDTKVDPQYDPRCHPHWR